MDTPIIHDHEAAARQQAILARIAHELNVRLAQVEAAVELLDAGNTLPFVARYRKEATGGLDDEQLRVLSEKLAAYRAIEARREDVRRLIAEQDKMTDDIAAALDKAQSVAEIDDIYRPFRPKRRTRASIAAERGLTPLAERMEAQEQGQDPLLEAEAFIDAEKGVPDAVAALQGAMDILAERFSDEADYRKWIRDYTWNKGKLQSKAKTEEDTVYRLYYDHSEPVCKMPSHRVLAVDRGEREGVLAVKIEADSGWILTWLRAHTCRKGESNWTAYVSTATEDAYKRLIAPSVENEVRGMMTEQAQEQAMGVFAENLKSLLMQPPVPGRTVLGFDPAYRTGCKLAVVGPLGEVLETAVIYPHVPVRKVQESERTLMQMVDKYGIDIISIGNGTASKESEILIAGLIKRFSRPVQYIMVSEAGASVYSASKLAALEFPEFDVSLRSAVSIARRLQDPMAELVKIDPKSIGVGQYQHDMNEKRLSQTLDQVVENCVSSVGADLNTASQPLLAQIAGITAKTAQNICDWRAENGAFDSRAQLKKVKGIGPAAFIQCAGFLRVPHSAEVLDNTAVHPESYGAARDLLARTGFSKNDVKAGRMGELAQKIDAIGVERLASDMGIGVPTLRDMVAELMKPGRDPRESLPQPQLRSDIMDISSLIQGMELTGTVRNVADFGAFVDIGVHQDGLVHISRLGRGFVKRAQDAVSIGDIIQVRVLEVDVKRNRISLERVL